MKHSSTKSKVVSVCLLVLPLVLMGPGACPDEQIPFAETDIFFEFNSTDLDLGIQIFFDADGWEWVRVFGPDGKVFSVQNGGGLKEIGSTEVFTESEEPELDAADLAAAIAEFQSMFPEGEYVFVGKTIENETLWGTSTLEHALPAPAGLDVGDFPMISWTDLSMAGDPEIVEFEIVVELVVEIEDEEEVYVFRMNVPADVTEVEVPEAFLDVIEAFADADVIDELKVELIATAANGNKSITEMELELDD